MERWYGGKYDAKLTTTEIAKRFRADVKAAIADGSIPKCKVSVRTEYFSGGSSIDVRVKELPFEVHFRPRLELEVENPNRYCSDDGLPRYETRAMQVLKRLEGMLAAYNHDGSHPEVDHFDVRFYGHVSFDHEWERAQREAMLASVRDARRERFVEKIDALLPDRGWAPEPPAPPAPVLAVAPPLPVPPAPVEEEPREACRWDFLEID